MNPMLLNKLLLTVEKFHQAGDSTATVADAVLFLRRHLGKSAAVTLERLENAIVAKTTLSTALGKNHTLDLAFEHVHFIALQQSNGGAETGSPLGNAQHPEKHLIDIGLAVMARACKARRTR